VLGWKIDELAYSTVISEETASTMVFSSVTHASRVPASRLDLARLKSATFGEVAVGATLTQKRATFSWLRGDNTSCVPLLYSHDVARIEKAVEEAQSHCVNMLRRRRRRRLREAF